MKKITTFAIATAIAGMLAGCGEDNRKITDAEYKEIRKNFCANKEEAKKVLESSYCKSLSQQQRMMPETIGEGKCNAASSVINGMGCGGFKVKPGSGKQF